MFSNIKHLGPLGLLATKNDGKEGGVLPAIFVKNEGPKKSVAISIHFQKSVAISIHYFSKTVAFSIHFSFCQFCC